MNLYPTCQFSSKRSNLRLSDGPFHRTYRSHAPLQGSHRQLRDETLIPVYDDFPSTKHMQSRPNHLSPMYHCHTRSCNHTLQFCRRSSNRKQIDSHDHRTQSYNGKPEGHSSNKSAPLCNGTRLPISHWQSQQHPLPMRLLWFRTNHAQQPKVSTLLNRFGSEGMEIQVIESVDDANPSGSNPSGNKLACELIMLECINTAEQEMLVRLNTVRANSRVPLIVLTDNHTLDWSLIALREGADAIFTVNTPDDIIIARSNALLRRWMAD